MLSRRKRDPDLIEHSLEELLRQRIGALSMGYEDLNDHDNLRHDPPHGLMAGKSDIDGLDRDEENKGKAEVLAKGENPRFVVTNFKPEGFPVPA